MQIVMKNYYKILTLQNMHMLSSDLPPKLVKLFLVAGLLYWGKSTKLA
jgi:hypothetical protein